MLYYYWLKIFSKYSTKITENQSELSHVCHNFLNFVLKCHKKGRIKVILETNPSIIIFEEDFSLLIKWKIYGEDIFNEYMITVLFFFQVDEANRKLDTEKTKGK